MNVEFVTVDKEPEVGDFVIWNCFGTYNDLKNNTPYLVTKQEAGIIEIYDPESESTKSGLGSNTRKVLKKITSTEVKVGDVIYFKEDSVYGYYSNIYKKGDCKVVTKIKDSFTLKFGVKIQNKDDEFGIQAKDYEHIVILQTIKKDEIKKSDNEIKIQNKIEREKKDMPQLQVIVNELFGSDYEKKPKILLTVYSPDGKEVAQGTADSLEDVQKIVANDYRLIGHKVVVYKINCEIQTEVPVTVTKLKSKKEEEKEVETK